MRIIILFIKCFIFLVCASSGLQEINNHRQLPKLSCSLYHLQFCLQYLCFPSQCLTSTGNPMRSQNKKLFVAFLFDKALPLKILRLFVYKVKFVYCLKMKIVWIGSNQVKIPNNLEVYKKQNHEQYLRASTEFKKYKSSKNQRERERGGGNVLFITLVLKVSK